MSMYCGEAVSDDYLQSLVEAYRDGWKTVDDNVEDGDAPIIARLESEQVKHDVGAKALGVKDATAGGA